MIYSEPTNQQGILEYLRVQTKADENTLPEVHARLFLNDALADYSGLAAMYSLEWRVDDNKHGDRPIKTSSLVSGTYSYNIGNDYNNVIRWEIEDEQGNTHPLRFISKSEINDITDVHTGTEGLPVWCYMEGDNVQLFPTPNYTRADALIRHISRDFVPFTGAASQTIGVPAKHENYIIYRAAQLYAEKEDLRSAVYHKNKADKEERKIVDFYRQRNTQLNPRMRGRKTNPN